MLVVEDQVLHAKLFAEFLKADGHRSVTALSGREGLTVAAAIAPDLIIVDILLPDIDGCELIAQFRSQPQSAETPILAISAIPDRAIEERCLAAGADRFLYKPVKMKDFTDGVSSVITARQFSQSE